MLFLRLSNCAFGEKKNLIIIKMHAMYVKKNINGSIVRCAQQPTSEINLNDTRN